MATNKFKIKLGLGGRSELAGLTIFMKEFEDTLKRVASVSSDMRPVWAIVKTEIFDGISEIFDEEGLPGEPWKPLNRRYAAKKRAEVGDRGILVYTGVMKASIQVERETSNSLKITAKDPKAPLHHFGGPIPGGKGTMPRRPFMFISDESQKRIIFFLSGIYKQALNNKNVKSHSRISRTNATPFSMIPVRTPKQRFPKE